METSRTFPNFLKYLPSFLDRLEASGRLTISITFLDKNWKKNDKTLESLPRSSGSGVRHRFSGLTVTEDVFAAAAIATRNLQQHIHLVREENVFINYKHHKNSPFEMADNFDQKFGDFIVTNIHVDKYVKDMVNAKCVLKTYDEIFLKYN